MQWNLCSSYQWREGLASVDQKRTWFTGKGRSQSAFFKVTCMYIYYMATHSSILAWKIPRTEEPGRLQSMGLQRIGCDWAHTCTHTHTPGITLLWFQFCLLNISCYWSRYWSSGLFLTTDGILIERFNDINTPTSGGSLSHDAEQLFQYSATPAWNSNFLLNYQAPLSCFLLYVSVTLSHISLEHLSECFEINNSHPGSLLAHKTPSYELEKGTPSLEKS